LIAEYYNKIETPRTTGRKECMYRIREATETRRKMCAGCMPPGRKRKGGALGG
jgi:hypothetical protein